MADTPATPPAAKPARKPAAKKPVAKSAAPRKPAANAAAAAPAQGAAKAKFAKAIDEARAGVQALGKEAQERTGAYREKFASTGGDWANEAKDMAGQAKERAAALALEGKSKASDALSGLGKVVAENATSIDEKMGVKYGDMARTAARSMQETAAKIEAKDLNELGEDAKEFVRKSPGVAIGLAAVAGFLFSRLFRKSGN